MPNFMIIAPEPKEPTASFQTVVRAKNATQAKRYIIWLHCLYNNCKALKVNVYPTCEDELHDATEYVMDKTNHPKN